MIQVEGLRDGNVRGYNADTNRCESEEIERVRRRQGLKGCGEWTDGKN